MWAVITNLYRQEYNDKPEAIAYFYDELDAQDYADYIASLDYSSQVSYVRELHITE